VRDKYKFKDFKKSNVAPGAADTSKIDSLFGSSGSSGGAGNVEVVSANEGPKTGAQKQFETELDGKTMDEMLARAMADPSSMDPSMLAAALPQLQQQLSEVLKEGISPEEIADVRKSFVEMGIDVNELFKALDEMEAAGLDSTLGADGKEFFKTLRKILTTA
jgi:hypothetical protein